MKKIAILFLSFVIIFSLNVDAQKKSTATKVLIETSKGKIKIKLYDETPLHRDNFIKLVNQKYYDGLLFHRVIKNFMIQGGDPKSKNAAKDAQLGNGGPGYTVPAEFNKKFIHKKGALSAARMGDQVNPKKESSGSQFYIVQGEKWTTERVTQMEARSGFKYTEEQKKIYSTLGGTPHLDGAYTVFGEVIEGLDVIDKIALEPVNKQDCPVEDIKIISAKIVK